MLGEFDIIRRYFDVSSRSRDDIVLGIGDDAAIVRTADEDTAIAIDAIVAGVHFPDSTPARAIGHRSLAVNLSDLAAMGAQPTWATLALSLPSADETWIADFAAGFFELANRYDVALIGGDTVRGPLQAVVQVAGRLPRGQAFTRAGGRAGDDVYLSGPVGDAAAGLRLFSRNLSSDPLVERFLYPRPQVELALALREWTVAAIDISDGVAVDVAALALASGCGAQLDLDALPLSEQLRSHFDEDEARYLALNGGDDYQLCFTVAGARRDEFARWYADAGYEVARIGTLTDDDTLVWRSHGKVVSVPQGGYDHFADDQP